jgi:hypothetical protein
MSATTDAARERLVLAAEAYKADRTPVNAWSLESAAWGLIAALYGEAFAKPETGT